MKNTPELYGRVVNKLAYEEASEIFEMMLSRFDNKLISVILELCNNNFRDAIIVTSRVLCNRKWLQHADIPYGAFKLKIDMFSFSTINIIKSIIYNESTVYSDKQYFSQSTDINPLGNIFKGEPEDNPILSFYLAISNAITGVSVPTVIAKYFYNSEKEYIAKIIGNSIIVVAVLSLSTMLLMVLAFPFLKSFIDLPLVWFLIIPITSFAFIVFSIGLSVMRNAKKVFDFGKNQKQPI